MTIMTTEYCGETLSMKVTNIEIETYKGVIMGELIVYEKGGNPWEGYSLMGFDEVGMFENMFTVPQYAMTENV